MQESLERRAGLLQIRFRERGCDISCARWRMKMWHIVLDSIDPQSLHSSVKMAAVNAHELRGAGDVTVGLGQFAQDVFAFIGFGGFAVRVEVVTRRRK